MADLTIDAADAIVAILNAADLSEGIEFARTFFPAFNPPDLGDSPSGQVFPAEIELVRASRSQDQEDHIVEIGVGRTLADEEANVATQIETVREIRAAIREEKTITTPAESEELFLVGVSAVLFVPELLRKRVALSVVRVTYRGWV